MQGACVRVVRQSLGGRVCRHVQSLRAGGHFLSLKSKKRVQSADPIALSTIIHCTIAISVLGFNGLALTYEGHILLIVSTAH